MGGDFFPAVQEHVRYCTPEGLTADVFSQSLQSPPEFLDPLVDLNGLVHSEGDFGQEMSNRLVSFHRVPLLYQQLDGLQALRRTLAPRVIGGEPKT